MSLLEIALPDVILPERSFVTPLRIESMSVSSGDVIACRTGLEENLHIQRRILSDLQRRLRLPGATVARADFVSTSEVHPLEESLVFVSPGVAIVSRDWSDTQPGHVCIVPRAVTHLLDYHDGDLGDRLFARWRTEMARGLVVGMAAVDESFGQAYRRLDQTEQIDGFRTLGKIFTRC